METIQEKKEKDNPLWINKILNLKKEKEKEKSLSRHKKVVNPQEDLHD